MKEKQKLLATAQPFTNETQANFSPDRVHPSPEMRRSSLAHLHGDIAETINDVSKDREFDSPVRSSKSSRAPIEVESPDTRGKHLVVHLQKIEEDSELLSI